MPHVFRVGDRIVRTASLGEDHGPQVGQKGTVARVGPHPGEDVLVVFDTKVPESGTRDGRGWHCDIDMIKYIGQRVNPKLVTTEEMR